MRSGGWDFKLSLSLNERHHVITTRRRTLLAPVFAFSLISFFGLTACGGEDTTTEPSTTTVTSAPPSESESSEPESTTVTSAPEGTPPPTTTVTSTPEPTQPGNPVVEEEQAAQQAPANQPRATSPVQKQPPMGNQGASPNCPAYLCGYGTAPNGAPNLTSGETQLLARCNSGEYNAPPGLCESAAQGPAGGTELAWHSASAGGLSEPTRHRIPSCYAPCLTSLSVRYAPF